MLIQKFSVDDNVEYQDRRTGEWIKGTVFRILAVGKYQIHTKRGYVTVDERSIRAVG